MNDPIHSHTLTLAQDLQAWLEWAELTHATELPRDPNPPPTLARPPRHAPTSPSAPPRATFDAHPGIDSTPTRPSAQDEPPVNDAPARLQALQQQYANCQACALHQGRQNLVFGQGNPNADLVLVGEAPGRQEDLTGEAFVGRAGQLLTRMLAAIGLERDAVYLCNIVKCRPPKNRDPLPDEISRCAPILNAQLEIIQPKVILTLGRPASISLSGVETNMQELRQQTHRWRETPLITTYHPAYLLREPAKKAEAWRDLLKVRALL